MRGERVLVTGATGFIGSHLRRALAAAGARVFGLTRAVDHAAREPDRTVWVTEDVGSRHSLLRVVEEVRPDLVFHLASAVTGGRGVELVAPTFGANLASTVALLEAVTALGCRRIVLAGSLEEPDPGDAEACPASPYAAAKWAASGYARMFHALYATPVAVAKLFMVYGPGQRDLTKLVPYVTLSLLRGEAPRLASGRRPVDWIYVDDAVAGLVAAATAPGLDGQTLEVGSGALVTVREVAERLQALVGGPAPLFGALVDRPAERIRAARRGAVEVASGWAPRVDLETGLRRTVEWYRAERAAGRL